MASPTRWTWVWVNSGSWWWTGRPGLLRFMQSQTVGHNWTELKWTDSYFRDSLRISSGKWLGPWYSNPGQPELRWFQSDLLLGIKHKIHSSEEGPLLNRLHTWYCFLWVAIPDHPILARPSLIFSVTTPPLLPSQHVITTGYFICGCTYVGTWTSQVAQMVKNPVLQCGRPGFDPWVGKIHWRRAWQPTPVFLPGESLGQRRLAGYRPQNHRVGDSWATKHAT